MKKYEDLSVKPSSINDEVIKRLHIERESKKKQPIE